MELIPITAQAGANFRKYYQPDVWGPKLVVSARMMLALVEYLEDSIDHPPVWAFTSHADLVLNREDTSVKWLVRISATSPNPYLEAEGNYENHYCLQLPWPHNRRYTTDAAAAARMAVGALYLPPHRLRQKGY